MKSNFLVRTISSVACFFTFLFNSYGIEQESMVFETITCPSEFILPSEGEITSLLIALKITNNGDKTIIINGYATPIPTIKGNAGKVTFSEVQSDLYKEPSKGDFQVLNPKHAVYLTVGASIKPKGDGYVLYGDMKDGGKWMISDTFDGAREVCLEYKPAIVSISQNTIPSWVGEVVSAPARIQFTKKP